MNRGIFFGAVRRYPFGGSLSQSRVDGITNILDEWDRRGLTDLRWLAYMLATVYHETAGKMQPIKEMGTEAYLKSKPYYPWVGMGLVQVTWEANAKKFGAKKPDDLLSWPVALKALFDGMIDGMFTARKLSDYFNADKTDWVNARRIINGTDKAQLIAGYAETFHTALVTANAAPLASVPPDVPAEPDPAPDPAPIPQPAPSPPAKPAGEWAGIWKYLLETIVKMFFAK